MFHFLKNKIRIYWHDLYYFLVSKRGVDFAMTCQDATAKIDLNDQAVTMTDKARVKLHVSLCQACNNYYSFSQILRRAIKKLVSTETHSKTNIEKLNRDLLQKHSKG